MRIFNFYGLKLIDIKMRLTRRNRDVARDEFVGRKVWRVFPLCNARNRIMHRCISTSTCARECYGLAFICGVHLLLRSVALWFHPSHRIASMRLGYKAIHPVYKKPSGKYISREVFSLKSTNVIRANRTDVLFDMWWLNYTRCYVRKKNICCNNKTFLQHN